ncbi:unnamed protein product [Linum trigynum]|uniref:Uncharacterized protein n=1 Tax=Linum trigynum TaxID=586398 RepID=A0AAV2FY99_9ROSI
MNMENENESLTLDQWGHDLFYEKDVHNHQHSALSSLHHGGNLKILELTGRLSSLACPDSGGLRHWFK